MNNFDFNDDEQMDRLDYLSDRYADFFEWIELLLDAPDIPLPKDWELNLVEPSDAELAAMNLAADLLVQDIMESNDGKS